MPPGRFVARQQEESPDEDRDNDSEDALSPEEDSQHWRNQPSHEADVWCLFHPRKWTQCHLESLTVWTVPIVEGGESAVRVHPP